MTVRELIAALLLCRMDAQVGMMIDPEQGGVVPEFIDIGHPAGEVDEDGNPIGDPNAIDETIALLIPGEVFADESSDECDGTCPEQCSPVPQDTNDE